jgi:competence protein ComEC
MHHQRRVDGVLAIGAAALGGGCVLVQPWPTVVAAALICFILRRELHRWVIVIAALAALGTAARGWLAMRRATEMRARVIAIHAPPRRCAMSVEVARSPVVLTPLQNSSGAAAGGRRARIDAVVRSGTCGESLVAAVPGMRVRLYAMPEHLVRGDVFEGVMAVGAVRRFDNPGSRHPALAEVLTGVVATGVLLDGERVRRGRGWRAWVDGARAHVRTRIEQTFAPRVVPHARALVLGEYDLETSERAAFQLSGLAHLLAVSGTHLILAVLALGRLIRWLLARIEPLARRVDVGRLAAAASIALSWVYADFAGGGGSAYRAAAMLTAGLFARALGRRPSGVRAFGWSLVGAAAVEPLAAHDLSFGLSVAATAGIMLWARGAERRASPTRRRWAAVVDWGWVAARATTAAHVACLPILLSLSSDVPVLAVAANVLAGPVGELAALPACLVHTVAWWTGPIEMGLAALGSGALELVRAVAHAAADEGLLMHLPPPTPWQLAALALALAARWGPPRRRRQLLGAAALAIGLLEVVAVRQGAPRGELRVTALDVGQGDGLLVDLPDGRAMLVDGGGLVGSPVDTGERVVLEVLRHRRRRRLDVVVLSHPHPDHYGGLFTVLSEVPVTELWVSGLAEATHPRGRLAQAIEAARARGTRVKYARELCGSTRSFGAAAVDVLGPCPTFDAAANANDNSLVIRLRHGRRVALLTGDAEAHQEARLLAIHGEGLEADLLKVGHHGSRTSTSPRWLEAVRPEVAMISCGVRNRFGHPHDVTLQGLARHGVAVLRTDRRGAVEWKTDGQRHAWRQHRGAWVWAVP